MSEPQPNQEQPNQEIQSHKRGKLPDRITRKFDSTKIVRGLVEDTTTPKISHKISNETNDKPIRYVHPTVNANNSLRNTLELVVKTLVDATGAQTGEIELFTHPENPIVHYSVREGYGEKSKHLDVDEGALVEFAKSAKRAMNLEFIIGHKEAERNEELQQMMGEKTFYVGHISMEITKEEANKLKSLSNPIKIKEVEQDGRIKYFAVYGKWHLGFNKKVETVRELIPKEKNVPGIYSNAEFVESNVMPVETFVQNIVNNLTKGNIAAPYTDLIAKLGDREVKGQETRVDEHGKTYVSTSISNVDRSQLDKIRQVQECFELVKGLSYEFFETGDDSKALHDDLKGQLLESRLLSRGFSIKPRGEEIEFNTNRIKFHGPTLSDRLELFLFDDEVIGTLNELQTQTININGNNYEFRIVEVTIDDKGNTEKQFAIEKDGTFIAVGGYVERLFPIRIGYNLVQEGRLNKNSAAINQGKIRLLEKAIEYCLGDKNILLANWVEKTDSIKAKSFEELELERITANVHGGIDSQTMAILNEGSFLSVLGIVTKADLMRKEVDISSYVGFIQSNDLVFPFTYHGVFPASKNVRFCTVSPKIHEQQTRIKLVKCDKLHIQRSLYNLYGDGLHMEKQALNATLKLISYLDRVHTLLSPCVQSTQ